MRDSGTLARAMEMALLLPAMAASIEVKIRLELSTGTANFHGPKVLPPQTTRPTNWDTPTLVSGI